eukprot:CAMPEP_0197729746 /NCGR_PEP_ID=MMETSP1434-20131217/31831_1 /TAXON_ID=265543 /ORGANISM="Minutocellus polymorphus, Strain CCMP3303" /LENGTH=516 /DNA_ID=CAMNT_0043316459 /DNA_START=64 /DNA_END=1611 /DNA_ORIENTATION=+
MPASKAAARDTALIVGASGSLGIPIVAELLRRGYKTRLLGRSKESLARAGYGTEDTIDGSQDDSEKHASVDIVLCKDVTDPTSFLDCWFTDASCIICVARPRSLKDGDAMSYLPMVENLCRAAIRTQVPRILIHGLPYLEENIAGDSPTMTIVREAEDRARELCGCSPDKSSQLTISRICEMSELGHLLEAARMIGFFPCAVGCNPLLHPISPRDFSIAVANYVEEEGFIKNDLLVGGPKQFRWRDLAKTTCEASRGNLRSLTLPLFVYRLALYILGMLPSMRGFYICLKLMVIPMTTNTASDRFLFVGSDSVEDYIEKQLEAGGTTWVHSKVFGQSDKTATRKSFIQRFVALPSTPSLARFVGFLATCDAAVALLKPAFEGNMQNLDVSAGTIDRHLVEAFGVAASAIAIVTLLSVKSDSSACEPRKSQNTILVGFSGLLFLAAIAHFVCPSLIKYSFGTIVEDLDDKTVQHARQISMQYVASAVQLLSLALGVRPERASGLVPLVWCLCSTYMW